MFRPIKLNYDVPLMKNEIDMKAPDANAIVIEPVVMKRKRLVFY